MPDNNYENILKEALGPDYTVLVSKLGNADKIRVEIAYSGKLHSNLPSRIFTEDMLPEEELELAKSRVCKKVLALMAQASFITLSTSYLMDLLDKRYHG